MYTTTDGFFFPNMRFAKMQSVSYFCSLACIGASLSTSMACTGL